MGSRLYMTNAAKFIAIIVFLSLFTVLVNAAKNPAIGYESSIYKSTSIFLWLSLISCFIFGIVIVVNNYSNSKERFLFKLGIIAVFLGYVIGIGLYLIRGYYLLGMSQDPSWHLANIKEIIINNYHIPKSLFYPITHIYILEFSEIVKLNIYRTFNIFPLFFYTLFPIFMYVFSKSLLMNKSQTYIVFLLSCTFVFFQNLNNAPNSLANCIFPFMLYILFKSLLIKDPTWKILLVIIVVFYPIFHPVPSIALLIVFVTIWIPNKIYISINHNAKRFENFKDIQNLKITLCLLLFIWWITWLSSYGIWQGMIYSMNTLINEGARSNLELLAGTISYGQYYGYSPIEQFFIRFGGLSLIISATFFAFPPIFNGCRLEKKEVFMLRSLYGPAVSILVFATILFGLSLPFSPIRFSSYLFVFGTIFSGYLMHNLLSNIKIKNIIKAFVIIVIIILVLNGLLKLYPSKITLETNSQTTHSEVEGFNWTFNHMDLDNKLYGISIAPGRFVDFLLSPKIRLAKGIPYYLIYDKIAYHFGYDNHTSIRQLYEKSLYMPLTQRDKLMYVETYPELAEQMWRPSDFCKLDDDIGIIKLYSNGGFDLWMIHHDMHF